MSGRRTGAVLAALASLALLTGCQGTPAAPASTGSSSASPSSASHSDSAPASSAAPARLELDGTEIARVEAGPDAVAAMAGTVDEDTAYDVVGVCTGAPSVSYRVLVGGAEVSAGSFSCGLQQRSSAVAGRSGTVDVELVGVDRSGADGSEATLAVIRQGAPWPGEEKAAD